MRDARYDEIKELVEKHGNLGAAEFKAKILESGVSESEIVAYSREADKRDNAWKSARRVRR